MGVLPTRAKVAVATIICVNTVACGITLGGNGFANADPVPPPDASSAASAPYDDPFYRPPADFGAAAPGTILRSRPVTLSSISLLADKAQAWQLLYRTTNSQGQPMATVTTVLRPIAGPVHGLVSYQIPEDASTAQCAPSRFLGTASGPVDTVGSAILAVDIGPLNAVIAEGFALSVPDYEGPGSEWGAAKQPGYAVLDGIRAAQSFESLGLSGTRTPTAMWGYSGGSLASGWAAQLQPDYAPELAIRATALGGFLTNPAQAVSRTIGTVFAGVPISVLPGLVRSEPALVAAFDTHLTPSGRALFETAGAQCVTANITSYPSVDLNDQLDMPFRDFMALPDVRSAFAQLNLGGSTPAIPLFVYHSVNDEMVPVEGVDETVAHYCATGASVTYVRDQASEHGLLGLTGAPAALNWLTEQLTGDPVRPQCTTRTVASALGLATTSLPQATRDILDGTRASVTAPVLPEG
ncbi:lipase family protein [Nocardia sp. alder85J]|uniref:lipase family protein n=1 Tax=Nocardia sp. alder85J TaxID=2862949 RepID=UPI001CD7D4E5|nr:lipase family protein [Nocardia sp. alder85J]MCX4091046.1 lipase family protein [Nocardia sp. alder85J]